MRKEIDVLEYASVILKGVSGGVLLTTQAEGKTNTMTISWGMLGIEWGKPVFTAFVRTARYSHELLEKNGEFTVNIPMGDYDKGILAVCGSKSGREIDKIKECGLTAVPAEAVAPPAFREMKLTLECRVRFVQEQALSRLPQEILDQFYQPDAPKGNHTCHTIYEAEIIKAYIEE